MRLLSTKIIVIEALLGLEGFDRCTDSDFFLSVWRKKLLNAVVSLDAIVASTPGHQHHSELCSQALPSAHQDATWPCAFRFWEWHSLMLPGTGWCTPVYLLLRTNSAFIPLLFRICGVKSKEITQNCCVSPAFLIF